jgi:hypothetical protein
MSRPRFLADHDLNEFIIDGVARREPAIEFVRAREFRIMDWPDARVLEFAAERGLIVVSHDVNTMTKHAYNRTASGLKTAGLLMVRQLDPIPPTIDSLILIWSASEAEEWMDQVAFLPI